MLYRQISLFFILSCFAFGQSSTVADSVKILGMSRAECDAYLLDNASMRPLSSKTGNSVIYADSGKNNRRVTVLENAQKANYIHWEFDGSIGSKELIALQNEIVKALESNGFRIDSVTASKGKTNIVGNTEFVKDGAIQIAVLYVRTQGQSEIAVNLALCFIDKESKEPKENLPSLEVDIRPGGGKRTFL